MNVDYYDVTERYYEMWLGAAGLLAGGKDVEFVYSAERNVKQYGYPKKFDIYVLLKPGRAVISYGDGAAEKISALKNELGADACADELKAALENVYGVMPAHSVKFVYEGSPDILTTARMLEKGDLDAYVGFFRAAHPNGGTDWIYEYFDEMVENGGTFVKYADGRIVSCADAPGMPYMMDEVQEIGIATLPEYRRRGHGLDACVAAARTHIANGKCPIWSAAWDNHASHRLAEKVGFRKYADAVMLSLE